MKSPAMTHAEAREALDILSKWFEVPRVDLVWSTRTTRGRAAYFGNTVKIGPRCWRGTTDSLLHEFSHLLAVRFARKRGLDGRGHGEEFRHRLHEVAAAWYGDPSRYGWRTEYANVREGIYKPEPSMLSKVMAEMTGGTLYMAAAEPLEKQIWVKVGQIADKGETNGY